MSSAEVKSTAKERAMSSMYLPEQMKELAEALERNGWTPADVKWLLNEDILARLLSFVKAHGGCVIDCNAKPFEPVGLTVAPEEEQLPNRVRAQFYYLDPSKIGLYFVPAQQNGGRINGHELRKQLADKPVLLLPANVLEHWLAHPECIPEAYRHQFVLFWGTIYHDSLGRPCVRSLCYLGGEQISTYTLLDSNWYDFCPAAVASKNVVRTHSLISEADVD